MTHRHVQRFLIIAFGNDNGETEPRDFEASDPGRRFNRRLDTMRCANGLGSVESVIQPLQRDTLLNLVEHRRE